MMKYLEWNDYKNRTYKNVWGYMAVGCSMGWAPLPMASHGGHSHWSRAVLQNKYASMIQLHTGAGDSTLAQRRSPGGASSLPATPPPLILPNVVWKASAIRKKLLKIQDLDKKARHVT